MNVRRAREGEQGVALITAISLLALFAMLGAAFMRYMALEYDRADMLAAWTRARCAAEGGIYAVTEELEKGSVQAGTPVELVFPVYRYPADEGLILNDKWANEVKVKVEALSSEVVPEGTRAYRLHSEAQLLRRGVRMARAGVGAVLQLMPGVPPKYTYWNEETPDEDADDETAAAETETVDIMDAPTESAPASS